MSQVISKVKVSTAVEDYLSTLQFERQLSQNTINSYRSDLSLFERWFEASLVTAEHKDILEYLNTLSSKEHKGARSTSRFLSATRGFFKHALTHNLVFENPMEKIALPKYSRPLPDYLSLDEIEDLLAAPDSSASVLEARDKVMLHLLFATGIRVSELVSLRVEDVRLNAREIRVIGKGNKERAVPFYEETANLLEDFMDNRRIELLSKRQSDALFPSKRGQAMTRQTFWHALKRYAKRAGMDKELSPHKLRHAFATHVLHGGADLRVVQLLLGHEDVSTTQIYTQMPKNRLKTLHQGHHPRG